ncbi:PKDCC-like protein [Mya arenaria]|uniref:PKDCC-like protein n=1 Tax=Mya arenaria TaxID=6604 RepID=A0ABY7G0U6_MYAAR|nr:extracellular tyrosine-protein kinase PKDCC-like [Mya arenaria]WAR28083.1 PKDCC-like protein [Mya arenaria]
MIGYILVKRMYRPYIVIALFMYACLMYRTLENTCVSSDTKTLLDNKDQQRMKSMFVNRDAKSDNISDTLSMLRKEYNLLENKRMDFVSTLQTMISLYRNTDKAFPLNSFQSRSQDSQSDKDVSPREAPDHETKYLINCENIHEVHLHSKIGHGVSKQTFRGHFRGKHVAVKMVTRHQIEVKSCIEQLNKSDPDFISYRSRCFVFSTMKLMKEILLLQQLNHPGFVRLLGFCVRNEESDTTDLNERGIVSVFELGERLVTYSLQTLTWKEKLKIAVELADFLHYLEFSPLGSLRIRDFKEDHFLMVNGSLKMIDLDDVDNLEPSCTVYISIDTQIQQAKSGNQNGCEFGLTCQKGMCLGFNARQNIKFMNRIFFKILLFPTMFPDKLSREVGSILADLDDNAITAGVLCNKLKTINSYQ